DAIRPFVALIADGGLPTAYPRISNPVSGSGIAAMMTEPAVRLCRRSYRRRSPLENSRWTFSSAYWPSWAASQRWMIGRRDIRCQRIPSRRYRNPASASGVESVVPRVLLHLGELLGAVQAERRCRVGHEAPVRDLELAAAADSIAPGRIPLQRRVDAVELDDQ